MSKYTMKDVQEAQYAMQFYDSMQKRIAELETENKHLRTLLSLRIQHEYLESQKAALEWAAKHISAHIHQAETTTEWEDSGPVTYLHCPLPTITYN